MTPKRTIKAKEIVSDIRLGLTNQQLMDKYTISLNGLNNIFRKLVQAHALEESELEARLSLPLETSAIGKRRVLQRNYVFVRLPIYDMENLVNEGQVIDINEEGFQVTGIETEVGENKGFLIQADYFADVYPFSFEAQCKWVSKNEDEQCAAGFDITSISEGGLEELRKLIRMLTIIG
jgi:hypothetical protein